MPEMAMLMGGDIGRTKTDEVILSSEADNLAVSSWRRAAAISQIRVAVHILPVIKDPGSMGCFKFGRTRSIAMYTRVLDTIPSSTAPSEIGWTGSQLGCRETGAKQSFLKTSSAMHPIFLGKRSDDKSQRTSVSSACSSCSTSRVTIANRKLAESPHINTPVILSTGPTIRQLGWSTRSP
jgi:hypothetical protein